MKLLKEKIRVESNIEIRWRSKDQTEFRVWCQVRRQVNVKVWGIIYNQVKNSVQGQMNEIT